MTHNTPEAVIEELKNRLVRAGSLDPEERVLNIQFDDVIAWHRTTLHQARQTWLREEIGRLKITKDIIHTCVETDDWKAGGRHAIQTIIDRYQKELDQDITSK